MKLLAITLLLLSLSGCAKHWVVVRIPVPTHKPRPVVKPEPKMPILWPEICDWFDWARQQDCILRNNLVI